ncbi:MAG: hypothetical protein WAY93_03005 [Atopobiaceae bacterium]|jgi:hypothetical protein|nr:hypothetical protein [Atopobiaceae bacterium]
MKKSNWAVFAILVVISAFLLWLWYYLGFNRVDNPFDLVLSICWWIGVGVLCWLIYRSEKKRQEQIRTIYVAPNALFNSERGIVKFDDPEQRVPLMEDILANLKYDFHKEDMPDQDDMQFDYVVRTEDFKQDDSQRQEDATADQTKTPASMAPVSPVQTASVTGPDDIAIPEEQDDPTWKGSVVRIDHENGNEEKDFDGLQQLVAVLA